MSNTVPNRKITHAFHLPIAPKTDWHPEDVKAAIRKRGVTMYDLSLRNGYNVDAVRKALRQPWPAVERIVADFLGVAPEEIWPTRYQPEEAPKTRPRGGKSIDTPRLRKSQKMRAT